MIYNIHERGDDLFSKTDANDIYNRLLELGTSLDKFLEDPRYYCNLEISMTEQLVIVTDEDVSKLIDMVVELFKES